MAKISNMTPEEIRAEGQRLMQLARQKEIELRNKTILELGNFLQQQEAAGFIESFPEFHRKLSQILNRPAAIPTWIPRPQQAQPAPQQHQQSAPAPTQQQAQPAGHPAPQPQPQ